MKPYVIEATNINNAFILVARALLKDGTRSKPRGMETIEIRNAWIEISEPGDGICTLTSRNTNTSYIEEEKKWYLSGSPFAKDIEHASKFWNKLVDRNGTINSNYGKLVMVDKYNGISQFEWCEDSLKSDPDTRQAVMNYNQPQHKYTGNRDFPCTVSQSFRGRGEHLDTLVHMRSNDIILGFTNDAPFFIYLQKLMAEKIGLKPGPYSHIAESLHVYERHFDMIEKIAAEELV
jgi:thymidylate synthase